MPKVHRESFGNSWWATAHFQWVFEQPSVSLIWSRSRGSYNPIPCFVGLELHGKGMEARSHHVFCRPECCIGFCLCRFVTFTLGSQAVSWKCFRKFLVLFGSFLLQIHCSAKCVAWHLIGIFTLFSRRTSVVWKYNFHEVDEHHLRIIQSHFRCFCRMASSDVDELALYSMYALYLLLQHVHIEHSRMVL